MKKYIDLHLHLDGSLPYETILKMAECSGVTLPANTVEGLVPYLTVGADCQSLNEYLEKFDIPLSVMQTEECLEMAVYDLLQTLSEQDVVYAEIRFAPSSHCRRGMTQKQVVAAAVRGLNKGMKDLPIRAQLILCCMRGADNEKENRETVETAKAFLGQGVCCLDLAGAEALFPTANFASLFAYARELEVPYIIHAGEAAGWESVQTALDLGAKRIGHGVASADDTETIERLKAEKIPLEVCVTSNVHTKAVKNLESHPIQSLMEAGVIVTLNSDNMTVSDVTLKGEYELVQKTFRLTDAQLDQLLCNGVDAAFLSEIEKQELKKQLLA